MRRSIAALLVLACCGCLVGLEQSEAVRFKPDYVSGNYLVKTKMQVEQAIQSPDMGSIPVTIQIEADIAQQVSSPDTSGNKTITIQYRRIKQAMHTQGMDMTYDSTASQNDPTYKKYYDALLKAKITVVVDASGKVVSSTGADEMLGSLGDSDPGAAALLGSLKGTYGDAAIRQLTESSSELFPLEAVVQGQEWRKDRKVDLPMLGSINLSEKCKLKQVEQTSAGKVAWITVSGGVDSSDVSTSMPAVAGMSFKKFKLDIKGDNRVNLTNSLLYSLDMTQKGEMVMTSPSTDPSQPPQALPMTFTMKMQVTSQQGPSQSYGSVTITPATRRGGADAPPASHPGQARW